MILYTLRERERERNFMSVCPFVVFIRVYEAFFCPFDVRSCPFVVFARFYESGQIYVYGGTMKIYKPLV